jgi:hypothetical protein
MKSTKVIGVFLDGDNLEKIRQDLDLWHWEYGVTLGLDNLHHMPFCQSSRAVLDHLTRTGKRTVIVPAGGQQVPGAEPVRGVEWLARKPDILDATPAGQRPLTCSDDGSINARDQTGLPVRNLGGATGSGRGSESVVYFTSQDHVGGNLKLPGGRPDEVLLHELVHALRQGLGKWLCAPMDDNFDTVEDFYAILVANIYRSENRYTTLRKDHRGFQPLAPPLNNEGEYYKEYRERIDRFIQEMPDPFCNALAVVSCQFNPIRRAMRRP